MMLYSEYHKKYKIIMIQISAYMYHNPPPGEVVIILCNFVRNAVFNSIWSRKISPAISARAYTPHITNGVIIFLDNALYNFFLLCYQQKNAEQTNNHLL